MIRHNRRGIRAATAISIAWAVAATGCATYTAKLTLRSGQDRSVDDVPSPPFAAGEIEIAEQIVRELAEQRGMREVVVHESPHFAHLDPILVAFRGFASPPLLPLRPGPVALTALVTEDRSEVHFVIRDLDHAEEIPFTAALRRDLETRLEDRLPGRAVLVDSTSSPRRLMGP